LKYFKVTRRYDESETSGIGHIIDGVIFDNGKVVICWRTDMSSIAIYESFDDFYKIHIDSHPQNESITEIVDLDTGKKTIYDDLVGNTVAESISTTAKDA